MPRKSRNTKQKEFLTQEIEKSDSFFTAEELQKKVNTKGIGITTVYRLLKKLSKERRVHSYLCNRKTIYSTRSDNHCHFVCQRCGEITHFKVKDVDFLKSEGSICHFQVDVHGICKKCQKSSVD